MKKFVSIMMAVMFMASVATVAMAADNPLVDQEKAFWKEFTSVIPKDKIISVNELHAEWEKVIAGQSDTILLDVRSHPEFDAFHIEGTSHIHAGHMYTIPKAITDPNAKIFVFCRTAHRAAYVSAFLYKYGYTNVYFVNSIKEGDKKVNEGGVVGWAQMGWPFVNAFAGQIVIQQYMQPTWTERNCGKYIREFSGQRGEECGKKTLQ